MVLDLCLIVCKLLCGYLKKLFSVVLGTLKRSSVFTVRSFAFTHIDVIINDNIVSAIMIDIEYLSQMKL